MVVLSIVTATTELGESVWRKRHKCDRQLSLALVLKDLLPQE